MNSKLPLALLCTVGLAACQGAESPATTSNNPTTTLRLENDGTGDLNYCPTDDLDDCQSYTNPGNCDVLIIVIDNVTGQTCETCEANGTSTTSCDDTRVVCTIVTPPEPDCVVCSIDGGAVLHSSCIPQEPECYYYTTGQPGDPTDPDPDSNGMGSGSGGSQGAPPFWAPCGDDECGPAPLAPNTQCEDGTIGGPSCERGDDGMCAWRFRDCPPPPPEECRICYDAAGNVVVDECGDDCSNVLCPQVLCAPGYVPHRPAGECCDTCVPVDNCTDVVCPFDVAVPVCPDGSFPRRDPMDCCSYYCEPNSCDNIACPAIEILCAPGYLLDYSYPNCCGVCVPDEPTRCLSDNECGPHEYCTAGEECLPPNPGFCDSQNGCADIALCYGRCRPIDHICDPVPLPQPAPDPMTDPLYYPYCDGTWQSGGTDALGCPLPPVCVCADGSISWDGLCMDSCANVACFAPPPECEPGFHVSFEFPYCCGICVPDDNCWPTGTDPMGGLVAPPACEPIAECPQGYERVRGDDCCDRCEPIPDSCYSSQDCAENEFCSTEIGDCDAPPGCDPTTGMACLTVCAGTCLERDPPCGSDEDCLWGESCNGGVCERNVTCYSSNDCEQGQICTTENGECYSPPCNSMDPNNCFVPAVCYGLCEDAPSGGSGGTPGTP